MLFKHVLNFSAVAFVLLLVFTFFHFCPVLGYTEAEAKTAIEKAESEILSCYMAVFEAEKAGANVSEPLTVLNEAGWLLSQAKQAYNTTKFDSAFTFANESRTKLNGFMDWTGELKRNAEQASHWDFMVNFVGSSVGAICVVVGGFTLWTFLKRHEEARGKV
ncbi:MAG: hypothetical protein QW270_04555 [Candidatus Bathyarchaeia archaeon]